MFYAEITNTNKKIHNNNNIIKINLALLSNNILSPHTIYYMQESLNHFILSISDYLSSFS